MGISLKMIQNSIDSRKGDDKPSMVNSLVPVVQASSHSPAVHDGINLERRRSGEAMRTSSVCSWVQGSMFKVQAK